MNAPILFYTPGTCALACMVALEWRGSPYGVCLVDREERGGERYRKINPRGQVPALRVDGHILTEVNAIVAHVADRSPELRILPPNGSWERDVANQWLAYFGSGLHPVFWPYFRPDRYTRDAAGQEAVKGAAVDAIRRELTAVNAHLASHEYVLGAELSALDGYLYAMARWGSEMLELPAEFPHLWRHLKALGANPLVRFATSIERGREPPVPSTALQARFELATLPE